MARIDGLLFGYTVFSVKEEDTSLFANVLLSLGISAKIKAKSQAEIRLSDRMRLRARLDGIIEYSESEIKGLPGFLYRNRKRYGVFLGVLTAVLILAWSSGSVWDVRVSGVDGEKLESTVSLLSELGVHEGARWRNIDKNALEAKLLSASPDAAWININRRGTVAYVTVKERRTFENEEKPPLFSNILASSDAVIEEINVKSGYPLVKAGDVVKRGDVLISGVIPKELGGGFCRAQGEVVGRVSERYTVNVSESVTEKHYFPDISSETYYKILGFSINILKNSRNSPQMCDIIENKSYITLFGKRLPIEKCITATLPYELVEKKRTADELLSLARAELNLLLSEMLCDSELLKIRTDGEYTDDGYSMYSDVIILNNIGTEREILIV